MVVEISDRESASIKYFAVKKRNKKKVATRFMPVKLLMLAKLSLTSFIYGLTENFCFPQKEIADLYKKYLIGKAEIFHVLTDSDSTALKFIFISGPNSDFPEKRFSDIIFEVIVILKIYKKFDTSHEFLHILGGKKRT